MRLDWLRPLCESTGPFATVVIDVSHETPDAEHRAQVLRRDVREDLARQGAPQSVLDLVDAAWEDTGPVAGEAGRAIVVDTSAVLLDVPLPDPPTAQRVAWGAQPDLLAFVGAVPEPVAAVVVRIDERGGEVRGPGATGADQVSGRGKPLHKVRAGGWSHLAMQERVEETWRQNAAAVAERVDAHVRAGGARLLVVAGDVRSRARLASALPERSARIVREVDRPGNATDDDLDAAVADAAAAWASDERRSAFARYAQAAGRPDGLAATGLAATVTAASARALETLFVDPAAAGGATVWAGRAPDELATTRDALVALGVEQATEVPAVPALIWAAACSDASLVLLDDPDAVLGHDPLDDSPDSAAPTLLSADLQDGLGAVLRFPLAPPT